MKDWTASAALNNARWCEAVCRAHGKPGRFLPQIWVNAGEVPRFYPNAVTTADGEGERKEQLAAIEILKSSNVPGRWAIKDSFNALDVLGRRGFDVLLEASWIRNVMPLEGPPSDIVWTRVAKGPIDEPNFAMFEGRRGFLLVAGGMLYRSDGVVGLSNVVADSADAVSVFRALSVLAARTFPKTPLVGYESGRELAAAQDAGFELGDPLKVWVIGRE